LAGGQKVGNEKLFNLLCGKLIEILDWGRFEIEFVMKFERLLEGDGLEVMFEGSRGRRRSHKEVVGD
jgi:hypothetical protein